MAGKCLDKPIAVKACELPCSEGVCTGTACVCEHHLQLPALQEKGAF